MKILLLRAVVAVAIALMASPVFAAESFITLCYHDIVEKPVMKDDITPTDFINQLDYFKTHGYTFVSPAQVLDAAKGRGKLPGKAVLLTFDDAYASFYRVVFPALKRYNAPAVLSVVSSWVDRPETTGYIGKWFMNWAQIREVSDSGLVTVASHTHGLHKRMQSNPDGNVDPAGATFLYSPDRKRYETDAEFRTRIREDLAQSVDVLAAKLGRRPFILTWPYGSYNDIAIEEAKKLGFEMILTLDDGFSSTGRLDRVSRVYLETQVDWFEQFKDHLANGLMERYRMRAVQVDLDMIVRKDSYEESDRNLGLLIERLVKLGVNTVFLQGFCDRDGSGNVRSLYFHNSVLPVEADFLSHAVNRIRSREMRVFVWMPALAYELPDAALNEELKVRQIKDGKPGVTSSWYRRLSPFDGRSLEISRRIFRDLAAHVPLDGILVQDDAYLAETEDFHPAAVEAYKARHGADPDPALFKRDKDLGARWARFKTEALDRYVAEISKTARFYRPGVLIARNIYGEAVTNPKARAWFAQDVQNYLRSYDYTVVMAYSAMEEKKDVKKWFREIRGATGGSESAGKVVFKLQAYDWKDGQWIGGKELADDMTYLLSLGVQHIAYYPDNVFLNRPDAAKIFTILSAREEVVRMQAPPARPRGGFLNPGKQPSPGKP